MLIVLQMEPGLCVNAGLTMRAIRLSSVISTPAARAPVVLMLIAREVVLELCVNVARVTLVIPSLSVAWSLAPPAPVGPMLIAPPPEGLRCVSARVDTLAIPTPTVGSTPVLQVLVGREPSVRTMAVPPSASVHLLTSETLMSHADWTLVKETLVDPTPNVPGVERGRCVGASMVT